MKKIVEILLKQATKIALKRNGYRIVAITGSAGKTSTKKAISLVLKQKYKVLVTEEENYNTEFGLPLTVLGKRTPPSKFGWISLTLSSFFSSLKKTNYEYLIVEMAADKPGDIEYLADFVRPNVAVVTNIFPVHLLKFKTIDSITSEKAKILNGLQEGDWAVLNYDDNKVARMKVPAEAQSISFGKKSDRVKIVSQKIDHEISVNTFIVDGKEIEVTVRALGEHLLTIFGAAIAVGLAEGVPLESIITGLEKFQPIKGRSNIIEGIKGSLIIDDSYNANPASMKVAINTLQKIRGERRIALLGNMNELGDSQESGHREVAEFLKGKCDVLVTVGEVARRYIADEIKKSEKIPIFSFMKSEQAGDFLSDYIKKGDVILAKGSQNGVWMERAVKKIMAEPNRAGQLLPRQSNSWSKK